MGTKRPGEGKVKVILLLSDEMFAFEMLVPWFLTINNQCVQYKISLGFPLSRRHGILDFSGIRLNSFVSPRPSWRGAGPCLLRKFQN